MNKTPTQTIDGIVFLNCPILNYDKLGRNPDFGPMRGISLENKVGDKMCSNQKYKPPGIFLQKSEF